MNKNKFLYVAALFGMMVLVSCSSHDSAKNVTVTSEQGRAESQAASDIVSKPLTLLQSNDGWSYGAAGAKGFYFVSAAVRSDDSTSLMYCDYDTMQQILLCSQPNCAHNTAACNGYLPYSAGGIVPEIVGQNLVLFLSGQCSCRRKRNPAAHRNDRVRRFRPNRNDHLCSQPRVSAPNGHRRDFYLCLYVGNLRQLNGKLSGTHRPNCRNLRKDVFHGQHMDQRRCR